MAKISGIGCSSKTPDYFLNASHGFNSVHGRMPSVLTGANLANRDLIYLGVSGDGDSASIGLGQFAHSMRRGVNMTYIVENNGVYGLTKGQFSATADQGSKSKRGLTNNDNAIDLVAMALQLGATYVARSFSGDKTQLVPLIKGAIEHQGAAFIDVISPCVAFNNHAGSTKSFDYVREHNEAVNRLDFISARAPIHVDYDPGTTQMVEQHDGSRLVLKKVSADYDANDRLGAMIDARKGVQREAGHLAFVLPRSLRRGLQGPDRHQAVCVPQPRRTRRWRGNQTRFAVGIHLPWSIGTYAKMFSITRQTVINDDLGFLDTLPAAMADAALRTLSDLVWKRFANAGSFFFLIRQRKLSGRRGTSLQVSSLQSLVALMRGSARRCRQ